jgi:hypothetical protein
MDSGIIVIIKQDHHHHHHPEEEVRVSGHEHGGGIAAASTSGALAFRCGVECSSTLVVPSELYRRSSSLGFYSDAIFYTDIKSFQDPELA